MEGIVVGLRQIAVRLGCALAVGCCLALGVLNVAGQVVISEFLAENEAGLKDEDGTASDWIEIQNRGTNSVNLAGWSLSDDSDNPGQWTFPSRVLGPGSFLVVFASGKDRKPSGTNALHTNFKLSTAGEHLGLYAPGTNPVPVSGFQPAYPEQRTDYSYGMNPAARLVYFAAPTPGALNGFSPITNVVAEVHFNVRRCLFNNPFHLILHSTTPGTRIRYTRDGAPPSLSHGTDYTGPVRIAGTSIIRAAAFKENCLPSVVATHSYFYSLPGALGSLPVLSLVTATNNLIGRTGITGIGGGVYSNGVWKAVSTNDYFNPNNHGIAWERPVSAELILPWDDGGFQADCGLRVQGSGAIRPRYTPTSKFSWRLYFRGDYGPDRLDYPFFDGCPTERYDVISLRAGHNDTTNPFIKDELIRRLAIDMGQEHSHGTFVNLYINGEYRGYYNPCERIENGFLQGHHGGGESWDVITVGSVALEGDTTAWGQFRSYVTNHNQAIASNYLGTLKRMDVTNFIDYLLVNAYGATRDWPYNNWRAARERVTNGLFRFYVWDAEGAFGTFGQTVTYDIFNANTNIAGDVLATGTREIPRIYQALTNSPEFQLFFADRVHRHLFYGGALSDSNVLRHFHLMRSNLAGVIPTMNLAIATDWVPNRRPVLLEHLAAQGVLASSNAPAFNRYGGRVPGGFALTMSNREGIIYFTTDGTDPRVPFAGTVSAAAQQCPSNGPITLDRSMWIKARSLARGTWSALTEAEFQVGGLMPPVRFTEIMYNPPGGSAYEFFELKNVGPAPIDLGGCRFEGVSLVLPKPAVMPPGAVWLIVNKLSPSQFQARYPGVTVHGWFDGNLSNDGERLALIDPDGNILTAVDYRDDDGWPTDADGGGRSLQRIDLFGDPNTPANWGASARAGGAPGIADSFQPYPFQIRFSEVQAINVDSVTNSGVTPDWIELRNLSKASVDITGWSLSDDGNPRKFVFPVGTRMEPGSFVVLWCDTNSTLSGFRAGFALDGDGETITLFDSWTNRVDALTFGRQIAGCSMGYLESSWNLCVPTPGAVNLAAEQAPITQVVLNEWMANALPGEPDWVELFNTNAHLPIALKGLHIASGDRVDQIAALSFLGPEEHLLLLCDAQPGSRHLNLKLPAEGSQLALYDAEGIRFYAYNNSAQLEGVSRGRVPDGGATVLNFYSKGTPGARNSLYAAAPLQLNELMTRNVSAVTNARGEVAGWIEVFNPGTTNLALDGLSLSFGVPRPGEWQFPSGLMLTGRTYAVIWCDPWTPASARPELPLNLGRSLSRNNGAVYLFGPDGQLWDSAEYGSQVDNFSMGKIGSNWRLLMSPTPGAANSSLLSVGPPTALRLNEWMALPATGDDWFEMFNTSALPVSLGGLFLADNPSIAGQTNFALPANSYIGPRDWALIKADGNPGRGRNHVPFALDDRGDSIRIYHPSTGALIDGVEFDFQEEAISQGRYPDGATNFVSFAALPTPGAMNRIDLDGDDLPDDWELAWGCDPLKPDADVDLDGDGAANLAEFIAGTHPNNSLSRFDLRMSLLTNGDALVTFEAVQGRSYTVVTSDRLPPNAWTTLTNVLPAPQPRGVRIVIPADGTNAPRFFRLRSPAE